jgi:A/G-specific adenine glycosylase
MMNLKGKGEGFRIISIRRIRAFREHLIKWYPKGGRVFPWRKPTATVYEKIISEILLQRTRAETVANIFPKFILAYPSWRRLANASEVELHAYLKPIGLWRRRTIVIQALSNKMAQRNGHFPRSRDEIVTLPGVGQYIGNAIMIFCHGKNYPLLDTNMARVLERYFGPRILADIRYDPYLQDLAYRVVQDTDPMVINWAILDLAAKICLIRNPQCNVCPIRRGCQHLKSTLEVV